MATPPAKKPASKTNKKAAQQATTGLSGGLNTDPNNFLPNTNSGGGAANATIGGTPTASGSKGGIVPTAPTAIVPENDRPYQLDPSIANIELPGLASQTAASQIAQKVGTPTGKGKPGPVEVPLQKLLVAYEHMFGKKGTATAEDMRVVASLGNGDITEMTQTFNNKLGKSGVFSAQANPQAPGEIKANKAQLRRGLAQEISKRTQGAITSEEILSHDPNDVLDIPVSSKMASEFAKNGYSLLTGQPLGQEVSKIGKGQEARAQAATGTTAQDQFNALMQEWDTASPARKQVIAGALEPIGQIPDPNHVSKQEIQQAYTKIVTNAAKSGISVAESEKALGVSLQHPQNTQALQSAETSSGASQIQQTAERLGVHLTSEQYNYLVDQATVVNPQTGQPWSQSQIDEAVGSYFKVPTDSQGNVDPTQLQGLSATIFKGFQTILDEYQIPMSNPAIMAHMRTALQGAVSGINESGGDAAAQISSGTSAVTANFQQYVQQQAAAMYPQFATQIEQGTTTKTLLDPYAQVAAAVLGYGTASGTSASQSQAADAEASLGINWSQPKWARALQGGVNPENGGPAPMSLDAWRSTLITDPQYGWAKTDDAKNTAVGVADHLLSVFGVPAAQGQ